MVIDMSVIEKAIQRFAKKHKIVIETYKNGGKMFKVRLRYTRNKLAIGSNVVFECHESASINPDKFLKRVEKCLGIKTK